MEDFEEAIDRVVARVEKKNQYPQRQRERDRGLSRVGPCPGGRSLPNADPVHRISIVPRGIAAGLHVAAPTEDRYLMTRSELPDKLAVLFGGRVAETRLR
jgi:cell division protease FtsH